MNELFNSSNTTISFLPNMNHHSSSILCFKLLCQSNANSENGEPENDGATTRSKMKNAADNDDILTRAMLKKKR